MHLVAVMVGNTTNRINILANPRYYKQIVTSGPAMRESSLQTSSTCLRGTHEWQKAQPL